MAIHVENITINNNTVTLELYPVKGGLDTLSFTNGWLSDFCNDLQNRSGQSSNEWMDFIIANGYMDNKWISNLKVRFIEKPETETKHGRLQHSWYTSGGDYGYFHWHIQLHGTALGGMNSTLRLYYAHGNITKNYQRPVETKDNGAITYVYTSGINVIAEIPFAMEVVNQPHTRIQNMDWGSFVPCIYSIRDLDGRLQLSTNCISSHLIVHFNNGAIMWVKTDINGKVMIDDLGDKNDVNRRIYIKEQHVHKRQSCWYPLTARVTPNINFMEENTSANDKLMFSNLHFRREGNDLIVLCCLFNSWKWVDVICIETGQRVRWEGDRKHRHGNLRELRFTNMNGKHRLTFKIDGSNVHYEVWVD